MLRRHLRETARRVQQLETRLRPSADTLGWSLEEQAQVCRGLLAACACGHVERTPEGYRAITDPNTWQEPFEIEPGRWEKRSKIVPELVEHNQFVAELLTKLFQRTGKYFPVYKGVADQPNPQFLAAVYRHYGLRLFE